MSPGVSPRERLKAWRAERDISQATAGEKIGVYPVSENSWMDMGQLEELDNMRRRLEEQNG